MTSDSSRSYVRQHVDHRERDGSDIKKSPFESSAFQYCSGEQIHGEQIQPIGGPDAAREDQRNLGPFSKTSR
ncbi:hypothetical protein Pla52o_51270 [Novipirellula galeiformis]|uniref:Uncharacterized protein n=1 Tax=Novipirellula galeiformis TaxID=2528004 RepID=A0A5C6C1S2_9BACT|nr:hypothetical protein Pla52o_51270 [Novipirellula galeiformis]